VGMNILYRSCGNTFLSRILGIIGVSYYRVTYNSKVFILWLGTSHKVTNISQEVKNWVHSFLKLSHTPSKL
jgi:hypothetical protein